MFTLSDHQMLQCGPRPILPIERKWKSNVEFAPNCPRCASANTKFCYYNNYSLSQPRYFCKGCRRYWTKGGSLRNVPVGGGCRKSRRGKSSIRVEKNGVMLSTNFNKNSSCFGVSSSSDEDSTGNLPGADIDLAVVFANFLNHTTSFNQPDDQINITRDSLNDGNEEIDVWNSLEQDNNSLNIDSSMECPKPVVVQSIPETYMLQEMPQVIKQQQVEYQNNSTIHQGLLETDHMNAFGLQNLLADEMVHDALWSDDSAITPIFEWQQPIAQLQQFESFPADDQIKISPNLMTEDWGNSFDLSGFGSLLSKPSS